VIEFSDVTVAHTIQLAVAPVFLLSGIGAILVVMTNRLGRIIDRARYWRTDWTTLGGTPPRTAHRSHDPFAASKAD
jgi:Protein of unknown function (DUF2721)